MKILLMHASAGAGHRRAAEALEKAFRIAVPSAEVVVSDIFDFDPDMAVCTHFMPLQLVAVGAKAPDAVDSVVVLEIQGAPEVGASSIGQGPDGSVLPNAAEAEIHGGARIEQSGGIDNIGFWVNKDDFVTWRPWGSHIGFR